MSSAPRYGAEPNVTPMIDVLLVLLITFMVGVQQVRREEERKQRLLIAQAPVPPAPPAGGPSSIVLEVEPGGRYAINRVAVPRAELAARLRAIYDLRPGKVLFVRGAPTARYQEVVEAMSVARGAGAAVIATMGKGR